MKYQLPLSLLALLASGGCSERDVTGPVSHHTTPAVTGAVSGFALSSVRSGALNIRKECSTYTGHAGEICTITSSNLKALEVGSTIH